jgi:hypothetical protein
MIEGLNPAEVERIKLTAGFMNAIASGTVLASRVAPLIGMGLGTVAPTVNLMDVLGLSLLGLVLAIMLHVEAR